MSARSIGDEANHAWLVHMQEAFAAAPLLADFEGWPDAPLLVRPAPLSYQQVASCSEAGSVRVNDGR